MRAGRPTRTLVAAAVAGLLALPAGCASGEGEQGEDRATESATTTSSQADRAQLDRVSVSGGDEQTAPTVTVADPPVSVGATTTKVLTTGSGPAAVAQSRVAIHAVFLLGSGTVLGSSYGTERDVLRLDDPELVPGLATGLQGAQVGDRRLVAIPPADAFGPAGAPDRGVSATDTFLVVADVLEVVIPPSSATGTAAATPLPDTLPQVGVDPTQGPTVTPPATDPPGELVVERLVTGTGPAVEAGQTVVVHYHLVRWRDGEVLDSSWSARLGFVLGAGRVIPGWETGLAGVPVGSRVLLVVPPQDGYGEQGRPPSISGTDTLVFVVDVLDAYSA